MVDGAMRVRGPQARSVVDCVHFFLSSLMFTVRWVHASSSEGPRLLSLSLAVVLSLIASSAVLVPWWLGEVARGLYGFASSW